MPEQYLAEILLLVALPLLLIGSAFFSGTETAMFSLTRHERLRLSQSDNVASHALDTLFHETRALLITILLGNMTVNVLYFALTTLLMIRLRNVHGVSAAVLTIVGIAPLIVIILLGEVLPKLIATRTRMRWSVVCGPPMFLVHRALNPIRWLLNHFVITPLANLIAPKQKPTSLSPQELQTLLDLSQEQGVIDHDEEQLLEQVLELGEIKVRELMKPRVDIEAYDIDDPPTALLALIRDARLKYIPVFKNDLDDIKGLIRSREALLRNPASRGDVDAITRPVTFVPEQQRADQLLIEFRKRGTTIAIVVDEYGGTAGLITIEDIVEHMVGDIQGSFERESETLVEPIEDGAWRVSAALPIRDWHEFFTQHPALDRSLSDTVSTLGGLVMAKLGHLPTAGDVVQVENVAIEVERMTGPRHMRIESLIVRLQPADDVQGEAGDEQ